MTDKARLEPSPVDPDPVAALLRGRRSVDQFHPDVPDEKHVRAAIEAARWAPNHHLTEPWHFYLVGARAKAAIIDLNCTLVAAAQGDDVALRKRERWLAVPGWLVMTCRRDPSPITAQEDYAACACAAQNLMLTLHSAGIASKWTSGAVTRDSRFLALLGADAESEYCVGLFWYGYARRSPRSQRTDTANIISRVE